MIYFKYVAYQKIKLIKVSLKNIHFFLASTLEKIPGIIILNFDPTAEVWFGFWLAGCAGREAFDVSIPFLHL